MVPDADLAITRTMTSAMSVEMSGHGVGGDRRGIWRRRARLVAGALLVGVPILPACGSGAPEYDGIEVTTEVATDASTKDALVFAPNAEGRWPVVVAFHGMDGNARDMEGIATRLAGEGFVVVAPSYTTDLTTMDGFVQTAVEAECGYRFARIAAAQHGGDLDRPVTFVGWSFGASAALGIGLTEEIDPSGDLVSCFFQVPRPDVIVAISGCHYGGGQIDLVDTATWGNPGAEVRLIGGEDDTVCVPQQTEQAADEMRSAGYELDSSILADADHFAPIFRREVDGELIETADGRAGERTLELILDAISVAQHAA